MTLTLALYWCLASQLLLGSLRLRTVARAAARWALGLRRLGDPARGRHLLKTAPWSRNRQGGGGPVRAAFRIMVVNLLLAALQGAPIARRMQEMSEADCVIAAQNAYSPDCTPESTAMNCMNEQLAPKCQKMIDYD